MSASERFHPSLQAQIAQGYRPCVGLMLLNADNRIFVGRRIDTAASWQMPQGGIDPGETPEEAAIRELHEEVGTSRAEIIAKSTQWRRYDLPSTLRGRVWRGRYRGQAQKWFLLRFTGTDADIDLARHHPEFDAWRWVDVDDLVELIVAFKRDVYKDVVEEFGSLIRGRPAGGRA